MVEDVPYTTLVPLDAMILRKRNEWCCRPLVMRSLCNVLLTTMSLLQTMALCGLFLTRLSDSRPRCVSIGACRRWEPSMLAVAVCASAAALFGCSWYFAEKIRADALAPEPSPSMPAYDDAQFVGLSAGHAWLRAIGDQPALFKPEVYGIAWQGGLGHIGSSVAVSHGVVNRPLTITCGSTPSVGQLAALDRAYFLDDNVELALGIPRMDLMLPGPLGPLPAWYFPGHGQTFVIGVHGQNGTRKDVLRVVDIVHRMGFPALTVTYRNDLGVAPDPSGYLRFGQTEWGDLEVAVRWALANGAREIVLVGQSMGAAIVAAFLRQSTLARSVARVVLEAPMLDLHAVVDYHAKRLSTPAVGRALAPVVWGAERLASIRFGVDWSASTYLRHTTWLKVPALVMHGDEDTRVPISISARLNKLEPSLVTFEVFCGAGHLESWNIDRMRYTSVLETFLAPMAP